MVRTNKGDTQKRVRERSRVHRTGMGEFWKQVYRGRVTSNVIGVGFNMGEKEGRED